MKRTLLIFTCAAATPLFLTGCATAGPDAYYYDGPPGPPPPAPPPPAAVTYYAPSYAPPDDTPPMPSARDSNNY